MPVKFQVPSLRIQIQEHLPKKQSEQLHLQQLLELGEDRVWSMAILEQVQCCRKVFVDRHRGVNENFFEIGRDILVFQTRMGKMPRKLRFRWIGPYWIIGIENGTFELGTLAGEVLRQKVNGRPTQAVLGAHTAKPFQKCDKING